VTARLERVTAHDPVIDKLLDDGREEMNRAKRHKIYEEAQKYVMEQAATIRSSTRSSRTSPWRR
jgi:ABC-type transport system substrate-binding protein